MSGIHNDCMRRDDGNEPFLPHRQAFPDASDETIDEPRLRIPPTVLGALLVLTVTLAAAFYIAAQVVQTP